MDWLSSADEPMPEPSSADDEEILQACYAVELQTYERNLANRRGCFCGATYTDSGVCTRGSACPRQELGNGIDMLH